MSCNFFFIRVWILVSAVGFTVMALMVSVALVISKVNILIHLRNLSPHAISKGEKKPFLEIEKSCFKPSSAVKDV